MMLNSFAFGSALQSYLVKYEPHWLPPPKTSITSALPSISTKTLLKPQPIIRIYNQIGTLNIEEYRLNTDALREQAILRAATSAIQIGKNEDGTVWVDLESITDPVAALEKKRATGGEKQICWEHVEHNLRWHSMAGTDTLNAVGYNIDYFASEYAQYKTRIEEQYTGEQRAAELAKLEQLFARQVEEAAKHFSQTVGDFLKVGGIIEEQDAIYNSFLDIYEQRKTTYLDFIKENPDYAGVKGTEDEWLLTAGDFMGEQLRYALISKQPEMDITSQYGYSVDDLTAAGIMVKELTEIQYSTKTYKSYNRAEEELGLELGLAAMKYNLITNSLRISEDLKPKLDQAFNKFIDQEINRVSTYVNQQRHDPFVRNKKAFAVDYDKKAVLKIIEQMTANLKADDVNAAFRSNLNLLISIYKNKMLDVHTGDLARYNAYYSTWVHQNQADDWNRFIRQLSISSGQELDNYLFKDQMRKVDTTV